MRRIKPQGQKQVLIDQVAEATAALKQQQEASQSQGGDVGAAAAMEIQGSVDPESQTSRRRKLKIPALFSPDSDGGEAILGPEFRSTFRQRLPYYIPILTWLPNYSFRHSITADIIAGASVAVLLVPQAIAYASLTGLPPIYGLYTSFFPMLMYFFMGQSRQLSVGPESATALLLGNTLAKYAASLHNPDGTPLDPAVFESKMIAQSARTTLISGLLSLFMGFVRLGFVDSVLSQPVLQGFIFSMGLLLITDQAPKLCGISTVGLEADAHGMERWIHFFKHIDSIHWPTLLVSIISISTLVTAKLLKRSYPHKPWIKNFPETLLLLVVATLLSNAFSLSKHGVGVLGHVAAGFTAPSFPDLDADAISDLLPDCLAISILGFVESGIVSKLVAQKHGYMISSNRELVALGLSNVFGSLFGAFAAYGSLLRTIVADSAGAQSQMASMTCASIVGIVILWLMPTIDQLPKAVISAMIFMVACSLLSLSSLRFLIRLGDYRDAVLCIAMTVVTFFWGIDAGLFFAFSACLLLLVRQTNRPSVVLLGRSPASGDALIDLNDYGATVKSTTSPVHTSVQAAAAAAGGSTGADASNSFSSTFSQSTHPSKVPFVFIVRVSGALHFANAAPLAQVLERLERFGDPHAHPASAPAPFFEGATISGPTSGAIAAAAAGVHGGWHSEDGVLHAYEWGETADQQLDDDGSEELPFTHSDSYFHPNDPQSESETESLLSRCRIGSRRSMNLNNKASSSSSSTAPALASSVSSSSMSGSRAPQGRCSVVFDLSECTSADSTALLTLLDVFNGYESRNILLLLVIRRRMVYERIMSSGADKYVSGVFIDVESAVAFAERYRDEGLDFQGQKGYESFRITHEED